MGSRFRNRYVLLADVLLIAISALGSYVLRLEIGEDFFRFYFQGALWLLGVSLVIKPLVYYWFGLYRRLWVYASIDELKLIATAVTVASLLVSGLVIGLFWLQVIGPGFPRSVLAIDWLLSLLLVGGARFSLRILAESSAPPRYGQLNKVLIIGAGSAGALVVKEMQKTRQVNLQPVAFLDDDPAKQGHSLLGVPVVGMLTDLARVLDEQPVDEVIIAIPTAPGRVVRLVADVCRLKGVPFRTMPGLYELLGGRVSVSRLREVDITDLLRRELTATDDSLLGERLGGRRVLVTGAGGSIGRELCRQIARWNPQELILLGHGENSIFESLLELRENNPTIKITPIIADVRDDVRIESVFLQLRPQVVFHAAAHKHVPLMQTNIEEAVLNNVLGTRCIVEAAIRHNAEHMVLISTDKAVSPSNVYGATKRLAEMIVLDAARQSGKSLTVVRFGNVLGSRGSIIPIFKHQIASGGPVTVTHPGMRRYFMTIPEAVHLVLQAAAMGQGGETFVLNMGQPVRILDLAEDLIRLSGLEPGRDIEIVFTGVRPGEKLNEVLWEPSAQTLKTSHPDIYRLDNEESRSGEVFRKSVRVLIEHARASRSPEILDLLDELVPGAAVRGGPLQEDVTSVV